MTKPFLTEQDFQLAATRLNVEVAAIKAVCEVEAPRGGFNPDGTPVTLFEAHQFFKYTKGRFAQSHPTLCVPKWTRGLYGTTWQLEQQRLQQAMALDHDAALMSASWGKFQVMGFNFATIGYTSVQEFVNLMYISEGEHLEAFCGYVEHNGLKDELQRHDWAGFAKGYNGAEFWKNSYDTKLATAYAKYKP